MINLPISRQPTRLHWLSPEGRMSPAGDGGFDAVRLRGHIEGEAEHHGGGENGADGVGNVLASDVRGGAVDRLIQSPGAVA